jgi:serine/threonine-protein kinase
VATDEQRTEELAGAVLDGQAVDWRAVQSKASAGVLRVCEQLKIIEAVAGVHRIPDQWGHLRLIERIGSGAFGDVYQAWDTRLDREVALKLLPADSPAHGDKKASSIISEGRLLARVHHPNVVTIHGAEQIGDRIGLWMELVRGRTLEQILSQEGPFAVREAGRIGIDLCSAIDAVHASGLIHRDIKAHNVMLAHGGRVVLMDFGTGRELDDQSGSDLTGTPLYVAPEVLDGGTATAQSDVYSLGVLLFHLLTTSYPVQGRNLNEIRTAHASGSRMSLRGLRPDVPAALSRCIECAIDPSPSRRWDSADAFGEALRRITERMSRRGVMRAAGAAAVLLAAGLVVFRSDRSAPPARPASIAVLPFENRGAAPGSDEFAEGLTAEIHRILASVEGLTLRSTGSSSVFKGEPRNLHAIAEQLNVDFVLEGSVSHTNNVLRIEAQLVRISDETAIWRDTFDRDLKSLPAILDDISLAIVNELRLKLGRGQRRYDLDPDLYYQFLQARALYAKRGPENSAKAADLFQQIVSRAPEYAPAWALLASALAELSRPSNGEEIIPPDPRLRPAAMKALQLDPLLAEAHGALANMYAADRDWVNARMSFLRAISLNPSLTETYTDFVLGVLMPINDTAEMLRQLDAARVVDPLSLDVIRIQAHVFVQARQYDKAIENCHWVRQHDPAFPYVDIWLGRALYFSGRFDEAQAVLEQSDSQFFGYLGYLLAIRGRRDEAEALIAKNPDAVSRNMLIYAGLGDKDRAYAALVRTAELNWWRAATWLHRREMALLHDDPRMPALRRKLRLPT